MQFWISTFDKFDATCEEGTSREDAKKRLIEGFNLLKEIQVDLIIKSLIIVKILLFTILLNFVIIGGMPYPESELAMFAYPCLYWVLSLCFQGYMIFHLILKVVPLSDFDTYFSGCMR